MQALQKLRSFFSLWPGQSRSASRRRLHAQRYSAAAQIEHLETRSLLSGVTGGLPSVAVTKGIVSSSASAAQFDSAVGPTSVAFADAATNAGVFSGLISSELIRTATNPQPLDANLTNAHPGDIVRVAVLLENQSSTGGAFDVTIRDTLPSGVQYVQDSLQIVDGTGAVFTFQDLAGFSDGSGLFSAGIRLDDPGATDGTFADPAHCGALDSLNPETPGRNIAIAFYDVIVLNPAGNASVFSSDVVLTGFAQTEGGVNLSTSPSDAASIGLERIDLEITKSASSSAPLSGDVITWAIDVTNSSANATAAASGVVVTDAIPSGQSFVSGSATFPAGDTFDETTGLWTLGSPIAVGSSARLTFQTLAGNSVEFASDVVDVQLSSSIITTAVSEGDSLSYALTVTNNAEAATTGASGLVVSDLIPSVLNYTSHTTTAGTFIPATGIWDLSSLTLTPGQSATINVTTQVATGTAGSSINFAAQVTALAQTDVDSTAGNGASSEDDDVRLSIPVRPAIAARLISGRAFLDADNNGIIGAESGVANITVNAYGPDGNLTGTAVTNASGDYTISGATSEAVRLEFIGLAVRQNATTAQSPPASVTTVSSVAFLEAGTANITANLALYQPTAAALFVTTCFVYSGQSTLDTTAEPAIVAFNADGSIKNALATIAQVGATNGVAVHSFSGDQFAAAFHKRHADIGPDGNSAIYRIDEGTGTVSTFIRLDDFFGTDSTGAYSHNPLDWFTDAPAFATVGKVSLGDIDISEDGRFLYTINLATRELIQIPIGNGTNNSPVDYAVGDTRTIRVFPILGDDAIVPTNGGIPTGELGLDATTNIRPFALTARDGVIYVGMVNSAESTNNAADLFAYVYVFDPVAGQFETTAATAFNLDTRTTGNGWQAWTNDWNDLPKFYDAASDHFTVGGNQPWLTDIEFDDNGDMILGFRDRTGDQVGHMVGDPTGADSDLNGSADLFYHDTKGEILRVRKTSDAEWTVEVSHTAGDGSEYYAGDEASFDPIAATLHPESAQGGLAQVPGFSDIVTTAIDPQSFWAGGAIWLDNVTGAQTDQLDIFSGSDAEDIVSFGKNNGLGDLEYLNNLSLEIGNRIWHDINRNGQQDAGEPALSSVDVQLFDLSNPLSPVLVGTTSTGTNGEYYFNDSNVTYADGADPVGLRPITDYELRIAPTEFQAGGTLNQFRATDANQERELVGRTIQTVTGAAVFDSNLDLTADTARNQRFDFLTAAGLAADGVRVLVTNASGGFAHVDRNQTVIFEFADGSTSGNFEYRIIDDRLDSDAQGFDDTGDGNTDRAVIRFTSGAVGTTDHSFDFGFVQTPVDLELSKFSDRKLAVEGDRVTFVLTVSNNANTAKTAASGITISDVIPAGLTFLPSSVTATQGTFNGTLWTLPNSIAPGEFATLRYQTIVNSGTAGSILINSAQVATLNEIDLDSLANNDDGDRSEDDEDDAIVLVGTLTNATVTNTVQIAFADQPDFDSLPGNDDQDSSEDDEATASFTLSTITNVFDFGDLPDIYGTLSSSGGPSHRRGSATFLGTAIDDETDGQPSATANGDGSDDDGVRFLTPLAPGTSATLQVLASTDGFLNAWIDFNADGVLDEITVTAVDGVLLTTPVNAADLPLIAGTRTLTVAVPSTANGLMAARFRYTSDVMAGLRSTGGVWLNGEVEDYLLRRIGDRVWLDADSDGTFDVGTESGLPAVTVTLSADLDGSGTSETYSTSTDANGFYRFDGVPAATYTVTVTPPTSLIPTFDIDGGLDSSATVTLLPTTLQRLDVDFGYRSPVVTPTGLIGDTVWLDGNRDGLLNGTETGISGVTVQLTGDTNGDSLPDVNRSTITNATGQYEFPNLAAGTYTITVTAPAGLSPTFDADGTGSVNSSVVVIATGEANRLQDFGYGPVVNTVDLSISKDNITINDSAPIGGVVTYTIVVRNAGPASAVAATVTDTLPSEFTSATWTATSTTGATFAASGTGSLAETVTIPAGATITYTVKAQLNATFSGAISNTATVSSAQTDSNLANNSATDLTTVTPLTLTPERSPIAGEPFEIGARGMSHVALVPFVVGTQPGPGNVDGIPVDIADPRIFMVGFVCVDDRIIGVYNIPADLDGQTLYFQAYESSPTPRLSNVVEARVGGPRVIVNETGGTSSVAEGSTTDTLSLSLSAAPTSNVIVDVQSQRPDRLTTTPATVTFTPTNWNTPQSVTLQAVNDDRANGDVTAKVNIAVRPGSDADFVAGFTRFVEVLVSDNDVLQRPGLTESFLASTNPQPTLNWSTVTGADSYDLWISSTTATATPIYNLNIAGTAFTPPSPLPVGRYNVWVRARTGSGQVSSWSPGARLNIGTPPTLTVVANGSNRRPTLNWNAVSGAVRYEVWINNNTSGATKVVHNANITGTTFTPAIDLNFGVHAVWVRAIDASNFAGQWSQAEKFSVTPVLLSPIRPTFSNQPTFTWSAVPGAATYEIYIRNGSTVTRQAGLTTASWTPPTTLTDGIYRWWVRGFAANGNGGTWTAPAETTIGGRPSVLIPTATGVASANAPLFQWTQVDGATLYSLYVGRIDISGMAFRQDTLSSTSYTHSSPLAPGTYRVWVRAISSAGTRSVWSAPVTFVVGT